MSFLLDTNIAIHIRDGDENVLRKFADHQDSIFLSSLTVVELQRGVYKNPRLTVQRQVRLVPILQMIPVLAFDLAAAEAYGRILAALGWAKGRDFDRMIAAHAISTRSVLITNNIDDFRDIPGLTIENWT